MAPFPSFTKTWHTSTSPSISPSRPELSMAGKSVVITGAGSGIGASIAESMALAGAPRLAIIGRRAGALASTASQIHDLVGDQTQVVVAVADVGNKEEVDEAFSKINSEFKGKSLDILVSNAGYNTGYRPFGTESVEEWTASFNVNIKGVYLVASAFIKTAASDATIIDISSALVQIPAVPAMSSYCSTKLAGTRLLSHVQTQYPSMHVVHLHPGQIITTGLAQQGIKDGWLEPKIIDDVKLPGNFAVWLASPEAKFLKDKFVWANWDVDELKARAKEIESSSIITIGLEGYFNFKY
ncbi:hypothetical protein B7494_g8604 [Chlorociboria aeruginascens]|nr:hypothetical protein B7494_g8604 [Chlorociboria aeruginascens]